MFIFFFLFQLLFSWEPVAVTSCFPQDVWNLVLPWEFMYVCSVHFSSVNNILHNKQNRREKNRAVATPHFSSPEMVTLWYSLSGTSSLSG